MRNLYDFFEIESITRCAQQFNLRFETKQRIT
jgi:hypothetical protein